MEGYTIISNSTITSQLSDNAYRIYNLLLSMCYGKDKDYCYPSQKYIAEKLHRSVRTVQRGLQELVKVSLIKIRRRGSISNIYTMLKKTIFNSAEKLTNKVKETIKKVKSYPNKKKSLFNSFPQRKYNYSELEKQLLGNKDYNPNKLIE